MAFKPYVRLILTAVCVVMLGATTGLTQTRGAAARPATAKPATAKPAAIGELLALCGRCTSPTVFAASGIESEIVAAAEEIEISEGLTAPVAQVGHLIAMKLVSVDRRRPNDREDLAKLASIATATEWTRAADSVALMEVRGFARGRDLRNALHLLRGEV